MSGMGKLVCPCHRASHGDIEIYVLDDSGDPLPDYYQSFSNVDELRLEPDWSGEGDLKALKGRMIRLQFRLTDARLYAFQIRP